MLAPETQSALVVTLGFGGSSPQRDNNFDMIPNLRPLSNSVAMLKNRKGDALTCPSGQTSLLPAIPARG